MMSSWHNFEKSSLKKYRKLGGKLLLLAIVLIGTFPFGGVQADMWDKVRGGIDYYSNGGLSDIGDGIANFNNTVGDASRQYENWELEQMYAIRPASEADLSFDEWKDVKGFTTRDGGILPTGDFSVTDYRQDFGSEIGTNDSLRSYMKKVINFVLSFLGVVATAMLIYAGYLYVTAGDGDGAEKAKKILVYVAIGIIIILASYAIVNTLIKNVGREGYDDRCAMIEDPSICDAEANCQWLDGHCQTRDFERTDGTAFSMRGTLAVEGHYYQTNGGYITPVGESLTFHVATPTVDSGNWDIGDGALHPLKEPLIVPFYDVGMRLIRGNGISDSGETFDVGEVVLAGEPINPRFSMPTTAQFGTPVSVQDQSTTPPRGGSIVGYKWECLDPSGTPDGPGCPDMSNFKKQFVMTFDHAPDGEYTIRLTVTSSLVDEAGAPATATTEKTLWVSADGNIAGHGLSAQFSPNKSSISLGQSVVADATNSQGAVEYSWQCWQNYPGNDSPENTACPDVSEEWTDKAFESFSFRGASGEELDPKYSGEYYLSLKVRDADGNESKAAYKKIIVLPEVPVDRPAARVRYKVSLMDQLNNFLQGLKAQVVSDDTSDEGEDIFPSQTIEIKRGQKIEFETYMPPGSPYDSLPYTVTWWWNGNVIGTQPPEGIENYVKTHHLKVVVADKNNQNKKDTLLFNVKVKNNLPTVKLISVETMDDDPAIPPAYARVKVQANDDADGKFGGIREYKVEAREAGRYLTMAYVPTDKEEIETLINLSPYPGPRAFVFKATVTDSDYEKASDQSIAMTINVPYVDDPTVSFTSSKTYAHTGEELTFYPSATGFPEGEDITYTWYWGDGTDESTTDDVLNHTFEEPGNRQVRLVASSENGTAEATNMVNIINAFGDSGEFANARVSIRSYPVSIGETEVPFQFLAEVEGVPEEKMTDLGYDWELSKEGVEDVTTLISDTTAAGMTVTFPKIGRYRAIVRLLDSTNEDAVITKAEHWVTVNPYDPTVPRVSITASPERGTADTDFELTASPKNFPEDEEIGYEWSQPKTGSFEDIVNKIMKKFPNSGMQMVKVKATSSETGVTAETQKMIEVVGSNNRPPVAKIISVSPQAAGDTSTVFNFYASATDPDGDELEYNWDMGDGNNMDIKNISYQFEEPGTYDVTFHVSDGLLEDEDTREIVVVAEGEPIPEGYENDLESFKDEIGFWEDLQTEALANETDPEKVAQLQQCLEAVKESQAKIDQLEATSDTTEQAQLNDAISTQLDKIHNCGKESVLGDNVAIGSFANNLESFSGEIANSQKKLETQLAAETDPGKQESLKKCIETAKQVQAKILVLEEENDPLKQQTLNDEITELLKKLHKCDPSVDERFITVRGTPETTFFFYGYAPKNGDRPLFFKWETEDGQHFVGQDISTKFPNYGVYEVKMIVSDGIAEATAAMNVKIVESSEISNGANLGAEVIDLSNPPKRVETKTSPKVPAVEETPSTVEETIQPTAAEKPKDAPVETPASTDIPTDGVSAMTI